MPPLNVILYTRPGCCLCDDALLLLERAGVQPQQVNIDEDSTLREQFNTCVPVVEINGKVRFRGRVNHILLKRLLTALSDDSATS